MEEIYRTEKAYREAIEKRLGLFSDKAWGAFCGLLKDMAAHPSCTEVDVDFAVEKFHEISKINDGRKREHFKEKE